MFRFGEIDALYGLLLVPILALFLWYALVLKRRALERFGELPLMRRLAATLSRRRQLLRSALVLSAVALLFIALARPQFGTRVETVRREGQDIVVALDVSNSMLAEDIQPNRLDRAKLSVTRLVGGLAGDRIGLVAFAGQAFVQSPLTTDYAAAALFLNAMEPGLIPVQGTDLGEALSVSLDAFDEENEQHRILVLITDGEDHEGEIEAAVDRAIDAGIRIYTVGIGSEDGVPIPDYDENGRRRGFKRNEEGEVVTTRLDEEALERIAGRTGGRYLHAGTGGAVLDALAEEIAEMEGRELEAEQVTQFEEQYQIFLGLALAILLIEMLTPERRNVRAEWRGRFQ